MPDLPSASTTLASIKQWSQPMFDSLSPYGFMAAGVIIGVGIIWFLIWIAGAVYHKLTGK